MVETETLKVPAISWRGTPRSTAASTLTLRSFEYAFMPAALHGFNAQATRCKALKAVGAAILGGLLSVFALPPRDADAAREGFRRSSGPWSISMRIKPYRYSLEGRDGVQQTWYGRLQDRLQSERKRMRVRRYH